MNCDELAWRLYDEDCRPALLGQAPLPVDVGAHLANCRACQVMWHQAALDTACLSQALRQPLPPPLWAALLATPLDSGSPRLWPDWTAWSWALTGGAVVAGIAAALPAVPAPWQWAGFCLGAGTAAFLLVCARLRVSFRRTEFWPLPT